MKLSIFRSLAMWLLLVGAANAADTPPTLDGTVEAALKIAPRFEAQRAAIDGAQAAVVSAGSLPDPEMVAGADNLPSEGVAAWSFDRDRMTLRKIGVMHIFSNDETRQLQRERAERETAVADRQLAKTRFETSPAVQDTWITGAVTEESLVRRRSLKPHIEFQAAASRADPASGLVSAAEALAVHIRVAGNEKRILAFGRNTEIRRAELARWIGTDAEWPLAGVPTKYDFGPLRSR